MSETVFPKRDLKAIAVRSTPDETAVLPLRVLDLQSELLDLSAALRDSRSRLRSSACESARRIFLLTNEVHCLKRQCEDYRQEIDRYASGVAIVSLVQALVRARAQVAELEDGAARAWQLEKILKNSHVEYASLAEERDRLADEVVQLKQVFGRY